MSNNKLFEIEDAISSIDLIYDADRSLMPARDLGEAIVGMANCLRIVGRIALLEFSEVYVYPIEEGSVKTKLVYINKHKKQIIVGIGFTVTLLNESLQLINRFSAGAFKAPTIEMIQGVDKKVRDICTSTEFRRSLEKVAQPLGELNQKVTIKYGEKGFEINCDNQYKFLLNKEEPILPELINGETVELEGEITRINKRQNDLGFEYKGRAIAITPIDEDKSSADYHRFLEVDKVWIKGVVFRSDLYDMPRIKVIEIRESNPKQIGMFDGGV